VEVCPNRANIAIPRSSYEGSPSLSQAFEILHVDYLCNECGNCGRFCPYEGEPFSGKPSLFESRERLAESRNAGFAFALSGADAARPRLFLRAEIGGELRELGYEEWSGAGEHAGTAAMLALASAVYSRHSYLLKGGEAR
jgi:putative selenate reductase